MDINICFGINNNYSQHCACTIASILYNSNPKDNFNIYIISDYISDSNKEKLTQLKSIRDFNIEFKIIDISEYKDLKVDNNLGNSAFYRLKAFEIIPADRVIYLDVDTIVRKDIAELFNVDMKGYYIAGAEDLVAPREARKYGLPSDVHYINSGVIVMDLKACRESTIITELKNFIKSPWDREWSDQGLINNIFKYKIKPVDIKWNCTYYPSMYSNQEYFHKMAQDPSIIHFIGFQKPWIAGLNPHLKMDYFKYLRMTPYFDDFIDVYRVEESNIMLSQLASINNILQAVVNKQPH